MFSEVMAAQKKRSPQNLKLRLGLKAPELVLHDQFYNSRTLYFQSLINWRRDCSPYGRMGNPRRRRTETEGARNDAALEILENKGFEIGPAVIHKDGRLQITVSYKTDSAAVEVGQELWDLAAGIVNLPEITARRKTGE